MVVADLKGQLVAVVGPSGVGKDTLLAAVKAQCPDVHLVTRVITRSADAGGEDITSVDAHTFKQMQSCGDFALSWDAHGLHYGIPIAIDHHLANGDVVVFNGSRAALPIAQQAYPNLKVIVITASLETLTTRLIRRGRETDDDIEQRLKRASYQAPDGENVMTISNDGALQDAVDQFKAAITPKAGSAQ
tara:strand:+ start:998 stop:1564 length:567 start_codon:yes stop_codon:yes gene_type:complete